MYKETSGRQMQHSYLLVQGIAVVLLPLMVICFGALTISAQEDEDIQTGAITSEAQLGEIRGKVLSSLDGQPIAEARIDLYDLQEQYIMGGYRTDEMGMYVVASVSPGTYKLHVSTPLDDYNIDAFYPGKQTFSEAGIVQVGANAILTGIDVTLVLGGHITGTVSSSKSGLAVRYLIDVYDQKGQVIPDRINKEYETGSYLRSDLLPGEYRILFRDIDGLHRPEYYDNQNTLSVATSIIVTAGQTTANIDAELSVTTTVASIATAKGLPNSIFLTLKYDPSLLFTINSGRAWQPVPTIPWLENATASEPVIGLTLRTEPGSPVRMLAAFDGGNVYRTGDGGESWAHEELPLGRCDTPDTLGYDFHSLVVSPKDSTHIYLLGSCYYYHTPDERGDIFSLFFSRDAGVSWQRSEVFHSYGMLDSYMVPSPVIAERVYLSFGGFSWLQRDEGEEDLLPFRIDNIRILTLDAQDPSRLYGISVPAGEPSFGKRSEDGGEQWVNWGQQPCGLGQELENGDGVLQLLVSPTQAQLLLLRCENGLYRSNNGGDGWTQLTATSGQLLVMDYGMPGRILWGKDDGLWASTNNGETWHLIMPDYKPRVAAPQVPLFLPNVSSDQP